MPWRKFWSVIPLVVTGYASGWDIEGIVGRFKEALGTTTKTATFTRYWQLNSRFDSERFIVITEGILNLESVTHAVTDRSQA